MVFFAYVYIDLLKRLKFINTMKHDDWCDMMPCWKMLSSCQLCICIGFYHYVVEVLKTFFAGSFSTETVTLGSIQIFKTHEFLARKPTIYFYCKGENKIILPDVKEKHFLYTFKGKESWPVCNSSIM